MPHFSLQFGRTEPGKVYRERQSVYGICQRQDEKLAVVRVGREAPFAYYLPGGGVETGESDAEALIREFDEETGLTVWPIRQLGRAGQFAVIEYGPVNALSVFFEVELTSTDGHPTDQDHKLMWISVDDALRRFRHDSHAWAVLSWDRERRRHEGERR